MSKPRRLSKVARRALRIIQKHGMLPPSDFARKLWETNHWMPNAVGPTGGAYLWRLRQMRLIDDEGLTEEGREALEKTQR